ncbi:MAG: PRTRC system protein B [Betaproteobacteria bacterium]|nr:PRTRC system protein B [Betaproteobacteria bacterium]
MNQAQFHIHTPDMGSVHLSQAVLIYENRTGFAELATLHRIEQVDGEAIIGAGRLMTAKAALKLAADLGKHSAHVGFLPDNVLCFNGEAIVWWMPPAKRHISFSTPAHIDEMGAAERGETVPHPGLVFAAAPQYWYVWAVKGAKRPTPATPLYQAPYFNVGSKGEICQGSASVPNEGTVEKISAWNDAFFRSTFTHPNVIGDLVNHYCRKEYLFWRHMLDGRFKRFPERVLIDRKITLGDLLGLNRGK